MDYLSVIAQVAQDLSRSGATLAQLAEQVPAGAPVVPAPPVEPYANVLADGDDITAAFLQGIADRAVAGTGRAMRQPGQSALYLVSGDDLPGGRIYAVACREPGSKAAHSWAACDANGVVLRRKDRSVLKGFRQPKTTDDHVCASIEGGESFRTDKRQWDFTGQFVPTPVL